MDVNKNSYTFAFAGIMVIVVAALLSFAATSLKDKQQTNVANESKQNLIKSIGVDVSRDEAGGAFEQYIKEQIVLKNGEVVEGIKALTVNLADEVKKSEADRLSPLFVAEKDGKTFYIIPVRGKGLWGPIWGYVALNDDANTIYGANFDHKTETPGLGAEINTAGFYGQFEKKEIMGDEGEFKSVAVRKGDAQGKHQVNGISGGTITSVGVEDMLTDCLKQYVSYFASRKANNTNISVPESTDEVEEVEEGSEMETANL